MVTDPNQIDGLKAINVPGDASGNVTATASNQTPERAGRLRRILQWLRAGYPGGVPREDYVALFGVLHRQLTDQEIEQIATSLGEAHNEGDEPIGLEEIRREIRGQALEHPSPEDIARVSAHLAAGGWPLSDVLQPEN